MLRIVAAETASQPSKVEGNAKENNLEAFHCPDIQWDLALDELEDLLEAEMAPPLARRDHSSSEMRRWTSRSTRRPGMRRRLTTRKERSEVEDDLWPSMGSGESWADLSEA